MKARLILEDGTVFEGKHIGADKKSVVSEIVFNTSMTGYLGVLTDPSYAGQSVCMTYPLIGNYGVCREDMESYRAWPDGLIVRELARIPSNFRCEQTIQDFLVEFGITGISGIDTRQLTRILREKGTMNGMITQDMETPVEKLIPEITKYDVGDAVKTVTQNEKRLMPVNIEGVERKYKIALMDFGTKNHIIWSLNRRGCDVEVFPADTKAEEILASKPDGIMLSNGPGDPKECGDIVKEIKILADSGIPIFAICLGHQLMALAQGGDTHKLKYGHRGANHPVKDLNTGRVYITSQNHGYVVDGESLPESVAVPSFVNVNDGTNEGLNYVGKKIFTVQFHPEAAPGPLDSGYLFDDFLAMI